jgi:NADH:ubiquinone oxidoreductase subunit E
MATLDRNPVPHAADGEEHELIVCTGECCAEAGAKSLLEELEHRCKRDNKGVHVCGSECVGHCQLAPVMVEDGRVFGWMSQRRLEAELARLGIAR